jgi:Putative zinc-finger
MVESGNNLKDVTCEVVWREISNYVEGEIDGPLRSAMDTHFESCSRCRSVLAGTRNVMQLYSDERMIEVPSGYSSRMEKRLVRNARERDDAGRNWFSWSAWLVPVAAMLLIAGGFWVARSWQNGRVEQAQIQHNRELAAKNIPPDMTVVVTADSKIFHVAACGLIRGKQVRSMTAKEALSEGYAPCTECLRKYLQAALGGNSPLNSVADAGVDVDDDEHGQ